VTKTGRPPFEKLLIANRGEIALRIVRACNDLGIRTVAVYSAADREALHVRKAHEAYEIGPAPASESYLRIDKLLEVAKRTGAEAIHPGYGFLSERAAFARACADQGLTFVGPPAAAMEAMGDKVEARKRMAAAGVPTLPGTGAFRGSAAEAAAIAKQIGFPLIVKASAGGGGKGMRVVESESDLGSALERARSEARQSFGDDTVYLERFVRRPRHIEVQVLFDAHGNGVALGERECSVQRRHQKLVEETPSPVIDQATRQRLGEFAVAAARAAGYVNAGTVEFLRDEAGSFYFMEMNARLQVEHPVTEIVYGVDLVEAQLRLAAGEQLWLDQAQLLPHGHAIECRITAEDPERNFMPCPGRIEAVRIPSGPGVREDSAIFPGMTIPIEYDPMIAKLITSGHDRAQAIRRMVRALEEYRLDGITTNISFLRRLMQHPGFEAGELHTGFLVHEGRDLFTPAAHPWLDEIAVVAASIHAYRQQVESALKLQPAGETANSSTWKSAGRRRAMRGTP
jgi:acetyl-CoA carboxylase biotin carboxylase subunit